MSKLTLDEAIKHCLETAEQWKERANTPYKCEDSELQDNACRECAADHRQLAEWLTELKELEAKHWDECRQIAHYDDEIKRLEATDVQPVRHGRWITDDDITSDNWRCCSNCYHLEKRDYKRFKFCPNCGADMRGD